MAYEVLTDDGYSAGKVAGLALVNLASTVYLLLWVLSGVEIAVLSLIIFIMFII